MDILTNLNLNKNELQNVCIQNLAVAPANPVEGQIYYNTVDKTVYKYDGTSWGVMGSSYTLPVATDSVLGGVKIGSGVEVAADGTITVDAPTMAYAPESQRVSITQSDGVGISVGSLEGRKIRITNSYNGGSVNYDIPTAYNMETQLENKLDLSGGTMTGDIAMGANSITGLAAPTNDADAATKGYVDSIVVGAIQPKGSITFANLPALSAGVLGFMYNIEDAFTTTADFIEGAGVSYGAGENVVIINVGTTESPVYKYDAYPGFIDTSSFATKAAVNGLITAITGTIDTSSTTVTVNYTGTLLGAYATQNGAKVITDVTISASSVVFTVASTPSTAITCTVVSAGALS